MRPIFRPRQRSRRGFTPLGTWYATPAGVVNIGALNSGGRSLRSDHRLPSGTPPASQIRLMEPRHDERDVVAELVGRCERGDVLEDAVVDGGEVGVAGVVHEGDDAVEGVELAGGVAAIGQAVRVDE